MNGSRSPTHSGTPTTRGGNLSWARGLVVALVVLALAGVLLTLDLRLDSQRRHEAEVWADRFDPRWLDPDRQPERLFDEILPEFRRAVIGRSDSVSSLFVTRLDRGVERLLFPDHDFEEWRTVRQASEKVAIVEGEAALGYLYIHFHPRVWLHTLLRGALLVVVTGGAGILLLLRGQARAIASTRVELAEKTVELYHLERLALVGRLAAGILHDLKKPVLNIRDDAEQIDDAATRAAIREQVDLFFALLRELNLEGFLARTEDRAEFVDLEEVVERSYRLVARQGQGVAFAVRFPNEPVLVLALPHRLVQVFSNLMLNALQAMPNGGELTLECEVERLEEGLRARIACRDTGVGIPRERLEEVFRPFQSYGNIEGSTGLGLYITRNLIHDLGGEISVDSEPGRGTTFTILLPLEEPPMPQDREQAPSDAAARNEAVTRHP